MGHAGTVSVLDVPGWGGIGAAVSLDKLINYTV